MAKNILMGTLRGFPNPPAPPKSWAEPGQKVGDFTTNRRVIPISLLAIVVGRGQRLRGAGAAAADRPVHEPVLLPALVDRRASRPPTNTLGVAAVLVPVVGGLIIGLMARYGSERIRGHGIPEAMEAILIGRSRMSAEGRGAQAALVGHLDRLGRPVRRRGADHHDRRRVRLDHRAGLPPDRRRAEDAAGRGRGRRHVGDVRARRWPPCCWPSSCCCSSGSRAASSRSPWPARSPALLRPLPARRRAAVPGAAACRRSPARRRWPAACVVGLLAGVLSAAADRGRLRRRGRLPPPADPLDVVAGARRPGRRRSAA